MSYISINALIAALIAFGLDELAKEVNNASHVLINDYCHFAVYDETGHGNEYDIKSNDQTTTVYGRLIEPEGGTQWEYRNDPDWEVAVPNGDLLTKMTVIEAIMNIKQMMPDYWKKTCTQRINTGTGSIFSSIDNIEDMEKWLMGANWEPANNPNIAPGCDGYVTRDIPGGQYGMVPVADQPDDTIFVIEDQKNTGKVSLVMQGSGRIPAKETWLIIGEEQGKNVIFTFHPGEPVPRATTSTEEMPVGTKLTKAEALAKGFNLAKVG